MPLNLRCVAAQAWRSTGSRRNFSSSRGSDESLELGRRLAAVFSGALLGHILLHKYVTNAKRSLEETRSNLEERFGPIEDLDDLVSSAKKKL